MYTHFTVRWMQAVSDFFNLSDILKEVPVDPASIVTVFLVGASVAMVLWYGRPRRKKGGGTL